MENKYITPTKESPIFKCYNNYFGYIEDYMYKDWEIHKGKVWNVGSTFALNLTDAITKLHTYIQEQRENIAQDSKFIIVMLDGTVSKYEKVNEIKCYSISMKQAKQFNII